MCPCAQIQTAQVVLSLYTESAKRVSRFPMAWFLLQAVLARYLKTVRGSCILRIDSRACVTYRCAENGAPSIQWLYYGNTIIGIMDVVWPRLSTSTYLRWLWTLVTRSFVTKEGVHLWYQDRSHEWNTVEARTSPQFPRTVIQQAYRYPRKGMKRYHKMGRH